MRVWPRKSTAVLVVVVAIGAAGVGWAATRAVGNGVITACVGSASGGALIYSPSGSCDPTQTTVVWNQQGPQGLEGPTGQTGPQGPPGAAVQNSGVVAFGPTTYKNGFTITAEIDNAGAYVADGSVDVAINPDPSQGHFRVFTAACNLYTGPPNGTFTRVAAWSQKFVFIRKSKVWVPSSSNGPVDINSLLNLGSSDVPLQVKFSCHSLFSVWTHPAITIEAATTSSFRTVVGAALPNRPKLGPGPLGSGSGQTH